VTTRARCVQPCQHTTTASGDRKVDTVASVIVTADTVLGAGRKAKAHIDAELADCCPEPGTRVG